VRLGKDWKGWHSNYVSTSILVAPKNALNILIKKEDNITLGRLKPYLRQRLILVPKELLGNNRW